MKQHSPTWAMPAAQHEPWSSRAATALCCTQYTAWVYQSMQGVTTSVDHLSSPSLLHLLSLKQKCQQVHDQGSDEGAHRPFVNIRVQLRGHSSNSNAISHRGTWLISLASLTWPKLSARSGSEDTRQAAWATNRKDTNPALKMHVKSQQLKFVVGFAWAWAYRCKAC
jgi:hypothetical protein